LSIVVFVNPRSRANRLDPTRAARFAGLVGRLGRVVAPPSLEAMQDEARRLAATPPQVIGIHGGDGTLHRTLSALVQAWGDVPLPPIALLAGGTMNVVAASLGLRRAPEALLGQIAGDLRDGRPIETVRRRCLRIGDAVGFVFGNGLMTNFLEEYYRDDAYGPGRAIWMLTRTFGSAAIRGGFSRQIFRRFGGRVVVDGEELPWRALTGVGAATVREIGLGFKLNHRADEDPDRFAVLAIHAEAISLIQDLWAVHRGIGVAPERAWSGVASSLVVEPEAAESPYTIDGDLYTARGRLTVELGPPLAFVRPR
jgi:diacylglycerol kinase family enzyme